MALKDRTHALQRRGLHHGFRVDGDEVTADTEDILIDRIGNVARSFDLGTLSPASRTS